MKSIKYLCWERIFERKVEDIRSKEFCMLAIVRGSDGLLAVFWNTIGRVLMFVFLVGYLEGGDGDLANVNVFTLIALFDSLTFPIGILPWAINEIYKSSTSFKRLNRYLGVKEIVAEEIIRLNEGAGNQEESA
jgi:hypothetical protein